MKRQCVVRTYSRIAKSEPMLELQFKLDDGWNVKSCTPYINGGVTECIEYILEKED